jgi:hypothetical protein
MTIAIVQKPAYWVNKMFLYIFGNVLASVILFILIHKGFELNLFLTGAVSVITPPCICFFYFIISGTPSEVFAWWIYFLIVPIFISLVALLPVVAYIIFF